MYVTHSKMMFSELECNRTRFESVSHQSEGALRQRFRLTGSTNYGDAEHVSCNPYKKLSLPKNEFIGRL